MRNFYILENPIQPYAWGSKTAIPELLGNEISETPQAELWMGAHPKSPSTAHDGEQDISLIELIEKDPSRMLGSEVAGQYGHLPYLFKILAASKPLSIQAHPNLSQAEKGFERENLAGIALDAPNRSYKDRNHKPECLCALTPFWGLAGFRKKTDMLDYLKMLCPRTLANEIDMLKEFTGGSGLRAFFHSLMTKKETARDSIIDEAITNAVRLTGNDAVFDWIVKLHMFYPEDIGVIAPGFLNLICLEPGQAIFLPAGQLHAYLDGVGMELMANSDNVLRGGLTPKYIDVPELLNVLDFSEMAVSPLTPKEGLLGEHVFETPAKEFQLSILLVDSDPINSDPIDSDNKTDKPNAYESGRLQSAEILLCTDGTAEITDHSSQERITLAKGMSIFIAASAERYSIKGAATIYKASVPKR